MSSWSPFELLAVFICSMLFGPILVGDHLYKVDTYLCMSFQSTVFSGDRWCICILFDFFLLFFFSKGSVFNTTQNCCCCSKNSRSSGILWTILLFLRDQNTCLHTDHFIQFNLTIKHKHLWRTFLAFKIIVIFIVKTLWEPLQRVVPMMTEKQAISSLFASRTFCNKFCLDSLWWLRDYLVMSQSGRNILNRKFRKCG